MESTLLSTLLSDMNRWRDVSFLEEQYKVRSLDAAIRRLRRESVFPWTIQKSTLRVFDEVLEYPVKSDHDELAYLDNQKGDNYAQKERFFYTSLQQFYEDVNNRDLGRRNKTPWR